MIIAVYFDEKELVFLFDDKYLIQSSSGSYFVKVQYTIYSIDSLAAIRVCKRLYPDAIEEMTLDDFAKEGVWIRVGNTMHSAPLVDFAIGIPSKDIP